MLRAMLQTLGQDARHNETVMQRFHERELALLGANDLVELLACMTDGMRHSFQLDSVKLLLLDPCFVIRDLLYEHQETADNRLKDVQLCPDVIATRAQFDNLDSPWLGTWDDAQHRPLFGRYLGGSVALLPLRQADGLSGFLCLGSCDRDRFVAGQATDFLGHLARIAAVCLENAVNRERLRLAGLTDSLTGLYNRRHLQHRLHQEVTRARRYAQSLSCLFVDADHFKQINDTHGHAVGDQVLSALAQRLRQRLRASDLATRYGGEEFAILLPQTDRASASRLAIDICRAVAAEPVKLASGDTVPVTVSIGVATLGPESRADGGTLLDAADMAVYRAKQRGRNRVEGGEIRECNASYPVY
jgi:diguanylate cyclase (GGDEF)-like protein